jgi:hypothetical protein
LEFDQSKIVKINLLIAFKLGWAIFWRSTLLLLISFVATNFLLGNTLLNQNAEGWVGILNFIFTILSVVIACYWFFSSERMGSYKLLLMELADYQKLASNKSSNTDGVNAADS